MLSARLKEKRNHEIKINKREVKNRYHEIHIKIDPRRIVMVKREKFYTSYNLRALYDK